MKSPSPIVRAGAGLLLALLITGCAEQEGPRAVFPQTTVNGQQARLIMDTGASSTLLFKAGARRLDVPVTAAPPELKALTHNLPVEGLSAPVDLVVGGQSFTAYLPVFTFAQSGPNDGMIGWPEVRENIFVFDSSRLAVTAVDQLPPETAQWTKVPLQREDVLLLKLTLPDGQTGLVLVDTGAFFGVGLTTAGWKAWRAAHPDARSIDTKYHTLMTEGPVPTTVAWADKVELGPLVLTDVTVMDFGAAIARLEPPLLGVLGLEALERMHLVVDGKNQAAYLQIKPPLEKIYPWDLRAQQVQLGDPIPHWRVAGRVRINLERLAFRAAEFKALAKDYAGAEAILTELLKTSPQPARVYARLGSVKIRAKDYAGALADLRQAQALDPGMLNLHWERSTVRFGGPGAVRETFAYDTVNECVQLGTDRAMAGDWASALVYFNWAIYYDRRCFIAYLKRGAVKQNLGDYAAALADYNAAAALRPLPGDAWASALVYAHLYRELLQRRLGQPPAADLAANAAAWQGNWGQTISQYLHGQISEKDFLAMPGRVPAEYRRQLECESLYYAGMMHLLAKDPAGARVFLEKCVAINAPEFSEYHFAKTELGLLDASAPPAP